MPELPEVEAARRAMAEHSIGKKIIKAIVADDSKVIEGVSPKDFEAALVGKTIVAAHRKGKNMWIQLDSPPFPSFQFGMSGAVYIKGVAVTKYKRSAVKDTDEWPSKYSKFFVELADGLEISFTDKRRFAKVRLLDNPVSVPPISELGPDALTEPMTADEFCNSLRKKNIGIKALLLDQSYISGIGNWMADEVLYQARIHPLETASSLSKESGATLLKCINEVIEKALEVGADSSQFPDNWIFHSREKKPGNAFVDGKKIDFIKAGGRVDETSENSEELLDVGEEGFKIEAHDLGNEDNEMLKLKNNDLENAIQQVLGIERADLENDGKQLLDIHNVDLQDKSEHVLEFERNGRERNCEQMLEVQSNDRDSNSDQMLGIPCNDNENATDARSLVTGAQTDHTLGKSYLPPVEGMEFESYDDAYNYYNCYAKELGFGIRVKSSWTKRNSNEKRGAVLCCNCEGFKTMKETCTRRKETRTGCLAMIRLRLVESNRWRLDEVKLEHNHLFDHQKAQNSRSHKKMEAGIKRKSGSAVDVEVKTIKLYRTPAVDAVSYGSSSERDFSHHTDQLKRFRFRNGDLEALHTYFRQAQLADPNFFYIMDLNDEGYVRNVFWIDSRSRAAYGYFGDVVVVDSTCLSNKHDIPLLSFSGLNHHGQSVLMGCGLLAEETFETYVWLMRAWLTCMLGRPPQTIVTDQCKALEGAISEVFPRAHHCLHLSRVMQSIHEKLEEVGDSQVFQTVLNRTVYGSMKIEEFETGWEEMIQHFANRDHEWLNSLYEDRERWAPVYLKNSVFAGIFTYQPSEYTNPFFHGYLDDQMTWTEFFKVYKLLQQKMIQREALDDIESREFRPVLRTRCGYEKQVSELYTKAIFLKFQEEVVRMPGCFSVTHIHVNGPIIRYMVKERDDGGGASEAHNFEVVYDKVGMEVRCICCCFSFRGYLCRHALTVLKYNGAEEIPSQYILTRWRKDMKRLYIPDLGSNSIDISNPVQWHEHLYRRAMQVVAEGMASQDHHMVAWQALKESLNKVRLAAEKPV